MKQRHPAPETGGGFIIRWDCGFHLNCVLFEKKKSSVFTLLILLIVPYSIAYSVNYS